MLGLTRRSFGLLAVGGYALLGRSQEPDKRASVRHFGPITAATMSNLMAIIDRFERKGQTDITLNISSTGGDLNAALSAYQYLKGRPINLTTHNFGTVDSAAVVLFCAGSKRLSTPLSRFVIHEPVIAFSQPGNLNETQLNERLLRIRQETDVMATVLSEVTKGSIEAARGWIRNSAVWTARQALDHKLVHEIRTEIQVTGFGPMQATQSAPPSP